MKLDLTDLLCALSFALDRVEEELLGIDTGHGRRVAYLSLLMGREAGLDEEELRDFVGCCLLHDNALAEFIYDEVSGSTLSAHACGGQSGLTEQDKPRLEQDHSVTGEENIRLLPFRTDVRNIILHHHENADGSGALGMTADRTALKAQILHLADLADVTFHLALENLTPSEFEELRRWIAGHTGTLFSAESADLFLRGVSYEQIVRLQGEGIFRCLHEEIGSKALDYTDEEVRNIAGLFARIVDYKSEFTRNHSRGVAQIAQRMARHYGFDEEKAIRFYFAGALHDIGKLVVVNDILEKPGKLTADEFTEMKNHAEATRYILTQIKGIPDIVDWASNHHERLNGCGYPRGLSAGELSFEDQLMACIDVYQALREPRPYKDGLPHGKTIAIMRDMADKGELNADIVRELDAVMAREN